MRKLSYQRQACSDGFNIISDRNNHATCFHRMFDQLMGACYLIQGNDFCDVESLPSCPKGLIDVARRFDLRLGWHIVTPDEKEPCVHENELPDRSLRHRGIRRVGRDGTALRQDFRISLDIRSESHLDYVMNSIGSQSSNALSKARSS